MTLATEIRKTVTDATPLFAAIGATDLAVERVREFDASKVQAKVTTAVEHMPSHVVASALEAAGRAEHRYESLATRGKELVDRIRAQKSTQELLDQGKATISRTKAAVTTGRKSLDETLSAALDTVATARKQVVVTVAETQEAVEEAVEEATKVTKAAAKKTATTARKRAGSTKAATKAVQTSAEKTAEKAFEAVAEAAEAVGEPDKPAEAAVEKPAEAPVEKPAEA